MLSIVEVEGPGRKSAAETLKRASITIRLSTSECARLRARAAESGMTISAYLRSCTLEVESLRAQVKDTLAQLRSGAVATATADPVEPRSLRERIARIWPHPRDSQGAASA